MEIRKATINDCRAIAELALMAGEGIPAYFWEQTKQKGETIIDAGARSAATEGQNFSYQNTHLAIVDNQTAGMLLAYRLPDLDAGDNLEDLPEFIRPLVELEQTVPGSYYVNMIATYPKFRNKSVGTILMSGVDQLAKKAGCDEISIEVFEQNQGALRLYQRLGYIIVARRAVVPHPCHPYTGDLVLLTRPVKG